VRPGDARVLGTLVVAVALARYAHAVVKMAVESQFIDFAYYYVFAVLAGRGLDPWDPAAVAGVTRELALRRAAGSSSNYPPLFHLLMQPWTWLPFRVGALLWLALAQACLAGALALVLRRRAGAPWAAVAAALFVVLTWQPLIESLVLGQANVLLLFLVTLAWWGLGTNRPWVAAAAVAVCPHVKLPYAALIAVLWWTGHAGVALRALGLAALGVLASVVAFGPSRYVAYVAYLASLRPELATWRNNLSPWATLSRMLPAPAAAGLALALNGAVVLGFAWIVPRRLAGESRRLDWAWGLGLCALLLVSPMLEEHYVVVLLLPAALLVLRAVDDPLPVPDLALLVASLLLLGTPYSLIRLDAFWSGPLALLASGRMLGVAALAWLLARRLGREA
jgi:hypothetical protein